MRYNPDDTNSLIIEIRILLHVYASRVQECRLKCYGHRIEKRRRICRQDSDGDGGAGEKKKRKTEAEVVYLSERELSRKEAQDWTKWRRLIVIRTIDAT